MTEITKAITARGKDIQYLSVCDIEDYQVPGKTSFFVLDEKYLEDVAMRGQKFRVGTIRNEKIGDEFIEELRNTTGLIIVIKDEKYLISDYAIPTLTIRAAINGHLTISRQNLWRNIHLADALISRNENIHFVYREIEIGKNDNDEPVKVRKIMGAFGGYFMLVPQLFMVNIAEKLMQTQLYGQIEVREWSITHACTDLYLEFPQLSKEYRDKYGFKSAITPGLFLRTSDIGDSSFIARIMYRKGENCIISKEVYIKHTKKFNEDTIMENVMELLKGIEQLAGEIADTVNVPLISYENIDLSTALGSRKNYEAVCDTIMKVLNKYFKKILSKKRMVQLKDCLCDEINSSIPYTLYDIAMKFFTIPERISDVDKTTLTEARRACAEIPKSLNSLSKKEEETLLLTT